MSRKFILINGPKRIGKSTTADLLARILNGPVVANGFGRANEIARINFADHLKITTQTAYGHYSTDPDLLDAVKDEKRAEFGGADFRRMVILMSEQYLKKLHGKSFFGEMMCRRAERETGPNAVILTADSGFAEEVAPLANRFGTDSIMIARLHRPGVGFGDDSRNYVHWSGIAGYDEQPAPYQIGTPRFIAPDAARVEVDIDNLSGRQDQAIRDLLRTVADFAPELGTLDELLSWADEIVPAADAPTVPVVG